MNSAFEFQIERVRMLGAIATMFPAFRPDNRDGIAIDSEGDSAETWWANSYSPVLAGRNLALAAVVNTVKAGHEACIAVYPIMKSRYRTDKGLREAIEKLPTQDLTPEETEARMDAMSALWEKLPLPPGQSPPAPPELPLFVPYQGMPLSVFKTIRTGMRTAREELPKAEQAFEKGEGELHDWIEHLSDLTTNGLIQGRAQFPSGVVRECIDAVPIDPVLAAPDAALLVAVLLPDKRAELRMTANHATRWDILHAVGAVPPADFGAPLASDYRLPVFTSDVLPAGQHHFKVVPKNSRGSGPASAVVSLGVV